VKPTTYTIHVKAWAIFAVVVHHPWELQLDADSTEYEDATVVTVVLQRTRGFSWGHPRSRWDSKEELVFERVNTPHFKARIGRNVMERAVIRDALFLQPVKDNHSFFLASGRHLVGD
jgi:hypothetical protein